MTWVPAPTATFACVFVFLAAACGASTPPHPTPAQSSGSSETLETEVIEVGQHPRQILRYRYARDPQRVAGAIDMSVTLETGARGERPESIRIEPVRWGATISPTAIEPGGALRFRFHYHRPSVYASPTAAILAGMLSTFGLSQVHGHGRVDARGRLSELTVEELPQSGAEGSPRPGDWILNGPPLPEEPVGVGARWQVVDTFVENQVRFQQTTTYTLEAVENGQPLVRFRLDARAPRQTIPAQADAPEVEVESMVMEGEGQARLDLSRVFADSDFRMVVRYVTGGVDDYGRRIAETMRLEARVHFGPELPQDRD